MFFKLSAFFFICLSVYNCFSYQLIHREDYSSLSEISSNLKSNLTVFVPEISSSSQSSISESTDFLGHDLFAFGTEFDPVTAAVTEAVAAINLEEKKNSLKLLGLVLDENPQAIIQDLRSQKTVFLHKGEMLEQSVVKEIQNSKVVFFSGSN